MCNVCCANQVLEGLVVFSWHDGPRGLGLEVEGRGAAAEFSPAKVRFRRQREYLHSGPAGPRPPEEPWSIWIDTDDLAGVMGRLGVDVKWLYVDSAVKAYLRRDGPVQYVEVLAADQRTGGCDGRN